MFDKGYLFLVSGRTGCGKTAVTNELSGRLKYPRTSFGDAVRREAVRQGMSPTDKGVLQKIGQRLVEFEPENLCRMVLESLPRESTHAFIEGLRHQKILQAIGEIVGAEKVKLLFVDLNSPIRFERLRKSRGWDEELCRRYDDDPTEIELDRVLKGGSDFVVDNSGNLSDSVARCEAWIASLGSPRGRE